MERFYMMSLQAPRSKAAMPVTTPLDSKTTVSSFSHLRHMHSPKLYMGVKSQRGKRHGEEKEGKCRVEKTHINHCNVPNFTPSTLSLNPATSCSILASVSRILVSIPFPLLPHPPLLQTQIQPHARLRLTDIIPHPSPNFLEFIPQPLIRLFCRCRISAILSDELGAQFGEVDFLGVSRGVGFFAGDERAGEVLEGFLDDVGEDEEEGVGLWGGEAGGFEAVDEEEGCRSGGLCC